MSSKKWAYGVTTVPDRANDLLPRTLESLRGAGFPTPRLFIDGECDPSIYDQYDLDKTFRGDNVRTFGNWVLAAWELYIRYPTYNRFAIFQDDFVTYRNLRSYLDSCKYPEKGYWNLYSFPQNEKLAENPDCGWHLSNQLGKGAVALVFDTDALRALLSSEDFVSRPLSVHRGHRSVDGGIVTALKKKGYNEYVHAPSLVQHTGIMSSMGNKKHQQSMSFRGEEFDAANLCSVTQ